MSENMSPSAPTPVATALPWLMLLFLGCIWGFNTTVAKLASVNGVEPLGYSSWQMSIAAILLYGLCKWRGLRFKFDRAHWIYYIAVGAIGTALPSMNMVWVLGHLPAGVMVLAISLVSLITYAMSLAVGLERFDKLRFLGLCLGLAGVLMIILPKTSLPRTEDTGWFLIGLLTPLCYSFANVAIAKLRPEGSDTQALSGGMVLVLALMLWPAAIIFDAVFVPVSITDIPTLSVACAGLIASVAYVVYTTLVKTLGPVSISMVGYVVTATGIAWGIFVFDETHSPFVWAAAAVICAGLFLVNRRQNAGYRRNK